MEFIKFKKCHQPNHGLNLFVLINRYNLMTHIIKFDILYVNKQSNMLYYVDSYS
jgi:hypothetical protein